MLLGLEAELLVLCYLVREAYLVGKSICEDNKWKTLVKEFTDQLVSLAWEMGEAVVLVCLADATAVSILCNLNILNDATI